METVSVRLTNSATPEEAIAAFREYPNPIGKLDLPTSPEPFIKVFEDPRFPQPRRQANLGGGMTVSVGRVRRCPIQDLRMVVLSHNTVRGAAGGAILNAELLVHQGYLKVKQGSFDA
jgi:aspartate-semialdehyde dehydrogenase